MATQVIFLAVLWASQPVPARIQPCNRVEVIVEDGREMETGSQVGLLVCERFEDLKPLFGGPALPKRIEIRVVASMDDWREKTGRPWYIAAALVNEAILTQPAGSLRKLADLGGTLGHELVHLLIRRSAGRNCPRWLEEGLAQWLAGQKQGLQEPARLELPAREEQLRELEKRMKAGQGRRDHTARDYAICLRLIDRLVRRVGARRLVRSLPALRELSDPLDLPVDGMPLRDRLFH